MVLDFYNARSSRIYINDRYERLISMTNIPNLQSSDRSRVGCDIVVVYKTIKYFQFNMPQRETRNVIYFYLKMVKKNNLWFFQSLDLAKYVL